jgi:hypothetical protein
MMPFLLYHTLHPQKSTLNTSSTYSSPSSWSYICTFFFTHIKTVLAGYDGTIKIYMFPNCIKRNPTDRSWKWRFSNLRSSSSFVLLFLIVPCCNMNIYLRYMSHIIILITILKQRL